MTCCGLKIPIPISSFVIVGGYSCPISANELALMAHVYLNTPCRTRSSAIDTSAKTISRYAVLKSEMVCWATHGSVSVPFQANVPRARIRAATQRMSIPLTAAWSRRELFFVPVVLITPSKLLCPADLVDQLWLGRLKAPT
jgi:hypothetical protein